MDWYAWSVLVLDGFAEPHDWILYVQTGRIIDLYMVSLLDSEFLDFKSGLRRCSIYCLELTVLCVGSMLGVYLR